MNPNPPITLPTRRLDPALIELVKSLQPGDRIQIVQQVRVGGRRWTAEATGVFRSVQYLSTGVTTDRVKEDDIVVPTVHFTKPNGELASIALDEQTQITKSKE